MGVSHIEAKLDSRGNFIDILPTGSRGSDEFLLELILINCYVSNLIFHDLLRRYSYRYSPGLLSTICRFHFIIEVRTEVLSYATWWIQ